VLMQAVSGNLYALLDDVLHANILLPAGPVGSTRACALFSQVMWSALSTRRVVQHIASLV